MATVTAANTTTISSSAKKKIIWIWQSNSHPWNENEQEEWKRYSDFQILVIEGAYKQKRDKVELGDYIINFKDMLEVSKVDRSKQRRVKREEIEISQDLREEGFCFAEKPVKSFTTSGGVWSEFITKWMEKNEAIIEEKKEQWSKIVEQAAQGIFKESKLLKEELKGQLILNELMEVKDKDSHKIFECCARLYSSGSFLHELINSNLRADDTSKIDTLGAYCYLLRKHLMNSRRSFQKLILYRGCTLTNEMIEEYKQRIGDGAIKWLGFTSTSRDLNVAESFHGNTLFIIEIQTTYMHSTYPSDISSVSHHHDEQEVLLPAGQYFEVENVYLINGKHVIYLVY